MDTMHPFHTVESLDASGAHGLGAAAQTAAHGAPALTGPARALCWAGQLVTAGILGQTLFFKFSGAAESRWIFETLGVEPWGRLAAGAAELVAVVLLLVPRTAALGALMAMGILAGAVGSHLAVLGIEVQGDGGLLFALALISLSTATLVAWLRRRQIPVLGPRLR